MTDICLLLRVGERPDDTVRKVLFSIAQHMFETKDRYMPIDASALRFTATMATDFEGGCQGEIQGKIFRAFVEYFDGRTLEALFLADYYKDWRELHANMLEIIPIHPIGGDPETNWMN